MTSGQIVVGYDGSDSSTAALDWAVIEATERHRTLRIVHVVPETGGSAAGFGIYAPPDTELLRQLGQETMAVAVGHVRLTAPDLEIDARVLVGRPTHDLLSTLDGAEMAVVGARGLSSFHELLVGSTSVALASHAHCPVVVIRPMTDHSGTAAEAGRIVVAADGSALSNAAVAFAFEEASFRRLGLTVLHAWSPTTADIAGHVPSAEWFEVIETQEAELLSESAAGWREKFPDVDVREVLTRGETVEALVQASTGAALLVVGSRGRGGFTALMLGSVSHAVLHHARCPVAVVRPV